MNGNASRGASAGRSGREEAMQLEVPSVEMATSNTDTETPGFERRWRLFDMHCHLDRMANVDEVARDTAARGIGIFCTTLTPEDAMRAHERFADRPHVRAGLGMHPWWVADAPEQKTRTKLACELAAKTPFVGEIGLDFSRAHAETRTAQIAAFEDIVEACAAHPLRGRILSIHAVRSADAALDILERHDMAGGATCIFHWFSGTPDDFARLRRLGCRISVNERMLATRRGREYARQMPSTQLLIETDAPLELDAPYGADLIEASLTRTLEQLASLRGSREEELSRTIERSGSALLGLPEDDAPLP